MIMSSIILFQTLFATKGDQHLGCYSYKLVGRRREAPKSLLEPKMIEASANTVSGSKRVCVGVCPNFLSPCEGAGLLLL